MVLEVSRLYDFEVADDDQVDGAYRVLDVVDDFDSQDVKNGCWRFPLKWNIYQGYPWHIFV